MVTAELKHNPYLQKTSAKFNGHNPRINCELENYEMLPLADWVDFIPTLFYNEMNGFDFDLDFVGTKHDFEIIKAAFRRANVSEEDVRIFLKNEIETPDVKTKRIDSIIEWLKNNQNNRFDYMKFIEKNKNLFEYSCSYIMVRINEEVDFDYNINVEKVNDVNELVNTSLLNTAIVFYLTENTMQKFREELVSLLKREDVKENQLFFLLDNKLSEEKILRVIHDLGINNPQRVSSVKDKIIQKYLRNYPISEYVREVINVLENVYLEIQSKFSKDYSIAQKKNKEIHDKITRLDATIYLHRRSKIYYSDIDNYKLPETMTNVSDVLREEIMNWKKKTTKIKGESACAELAVDFNEKLKLFFDSLVLTIKEMCEEEADKIKNELHDNYISFTKVDYIPSLIPVKFSDTIQSPNLVNEFLMLKKVIMEQPSNGLFDLFKKSSNEQKNPIPIIVCMLEDWRKVGFEKYDVLIKALIKENFEKLKGYRSILCKKYIEKSDELLNTVISNKEREVLKLSDEDKVMQIDRDWIDELRNLLDILERG